MSSLLRAVALLATLGLTRGLDNGGVCAGCTIVVRVIDMQLQQGWVVDPLVDKICKEVFAKQPITSAACTRAWKTFGPEIIRQLENKLPESEICKGITLCPKDSTCRLLPPTNDALTAWDAPEVLQAAGRDLRDFLTSPSMQWPWTPVVNHRPAKDQDNDGYSDLATLRGFDWRGKDCDDTRSDVYPGRKTPVQDADDSNCNGISDQDEEELCAKSEMRRLVLFGDSAGAHFHVPWGLNGSNPNAIKQAVYMLENELDYPQWSWSTGFDTGSDEHAYPEGEVDSIYMRLVDRNRCNANFRQNLGVNGARSTAVVPDKTDSLASSPEDDLPAIVFYAMVGNDVINPHIPEPVNAEHQTSPEEFREKVMDALATFDTLLPNGSHVVLVGLEHAGHIWPNLQAREHPGLSIPGSPVTYRNVWDLLNCNGANPGFGWLDANESYRVHTNTLAQNLSNVLADIAGKHNESFTSFDLTYIENPDQEIVDDHLAAGGDYAQLIEWVGGGHPSQTLHARTAKKIWETLEQIRPDVLGPVNPHNDKIDALLAMDLETLV